MSKLSTKCCATARILDVKKASSGIIQKKFVFGPSALNEEPSTAITIESDSPKRDSITVRKENGECSWYVDYISVERGDVTDIYPAFQWIEPNSSYTFLNSQHETNLPQNDPNPDERAAALATTRESYEINTSDPKLPASVKKLPKEEEFSVTYELKLGEHYVEETIAEEAHLFWEWFNKDWKKLDDLGKGMYGGVVFPVPKSKEHWREDWFFAQQRMSGVCPTLIQLCEDELPQKLSANMSTAIRARLEKNHLEKKSVAKALQEKRLFFCDLNVLQGIPSHKAVCSPILLLYKNTKDTLMPVAIQLFQDQRNNNPVFLPSDGLNIWLMAKMWYNQAETTYHESLAHLGYTHLLMEGVSLSVHRQLSFHHPILKLMAPHLLYIMQINSDAVQKLLAKNGWIDEAMSCGRDGVLALIENRQWRLDEDGTLPNDLNKRGVDDPKVLPEYHYRDDALLIYDTIKKYVTGYVSLYYDSDKQLQRDWEIQAFAKELSTSRKDGGIGINGIPGNGKFDKRAQLIQTLTSFIFTCSVQHAAVNFGQYDYYGFSPAYPAMLIGVPPSNTGEITEREIIESIVPAKIYLETMKMTKLLSYKGTKSLGDFEHNYIFDEQALGIVETFRDDLRVVGDKIKAKLAKRKIFYDYLLPENIPNSISI